MSQTATWEHTILQQSAPPLLEFNGSFQLLDVDHATLNAFSDCLERTCSNTRLAAITLVPLQHASRQSSAVARTQV